MLKLKPDHLTFSTLMQPQKKGSPRVLVSQKYAFANYLAPILLCQHWKLDWQMQLVNTHLYWPDRHYHHYPYSRLHNRKQWFCGGAKGPGSTSHLAIRVSFLILFVFFNSLFRTSYKVRAFSPPKPLKAP